VKFPRTKYLQSYLTGQRNSRRIIHNYIYIITPGDVRDDHDDTVNDSTRGRSNAVNSTNDRARPFVRFLLRRSFREISLRTYIYRDEDRAVVWS